MRIAQFTCIVGMTAFGCCGTAFADQAAHQGPASGERSYAQDVRKEKIRKGNCTITRKWKDGTFTEKKKCKGVPMPG
ncbi:MULTISPECIES: hypothetical protein [unclassified Sinorhizobium]|uniref:hypothetical protein n=1 Tax=unclassified Sinorhizobium TaxID=2613772 RepID=UPI0024C3D362|nr:MULTISPECIES: hypothetical protein [unclassified Sinorhizobium]MDK1378544.1 hypothetical protein [Sinorhizobium sp. 6-70]MDK1481931.1 hypothetical protein [Sinorhizobium sp. 6-117]